MSTFTVQYKQLFGVDILHRFFLDNGLQKFGNMSMKDQFQQLARYDFQSVFNVVPSDETRLRLNGHRLLLKKYNKGFAVWAKIVPNENRRPFIDLNDDLSFTFLVMIKDPRFHNYTDFNLDNSGRTIWLSNRRLDGVPNDFPLLDKADMNNPVDDKFFLPADVKVEYNCFAVVRIFMKGDIPALHITDAESKITSPEKKFNLIFKNRSTYWRYVYNADQEIKPEDDLIMENGNKRVLVTKNMQPLTGSGFISLKMNSVELPNPGVFMIVPDRPSNKIFSEIYM